jgi:adenylate kinase family enzyme
MTTLAIRQKLHNYLELADDKKVKALFTMIETEVEEKNSQFSDDLKIELDKRYEAYKNGNMPLLSPEQSKKRLLKILKQKNGV